MAYKKQLLAFGFTFLGAYALIVTALSVCGVL